MALKRNVGGKMAGCTAGFPVFWMKASQKIERAPWKVARMRGIAEGLAGEHRQRRDPGVAAHQPQDNGQRLADGRQEGEEPHHGPAPCEELCGPGPAGASDAQTGDPLPSVRAFRSSSRSCRRGCCPPRRPRAPYGVKPHAHQNDHDRFGTERQDAPGDQRRDEKAPVAPVDEKLRYGFHAGKDTK